MASREELMTALRNADAAGAAEDAQQLAQMIAALPPEAAPPQAEPSFLEELANPDPTKNYGSILPLIKQKGGGNDWGHPSALMQSAYRAVTSPGKAARGELSPDQMNDEARNLAGFIALAPPARTLLSATPGIAADTAQAVVPAIRRGSTLARESIAPQYPRGALAVGEPGATQLTPAAAKALGKLDQRLSDAGWTPERIEAKLRQLGPRATMADLEPFSGLQEAVAQVPGKPATMAARTLGVRDKRAGSALQKSVDENVSPENVYETIDDLRAVRSAVSQPLRQKALATSPIVKDPLVERLMGTPEMQQGLRTGAKIIRLESARTGEEIPKSETWFHGNNFDDPNITIKNTPTLRMLDAAKQGFDAMLKPFENKYTGKLENLGPYEVEIDKARRALVDVLRTHSDDYAQYLDEWAKPSRLMSAVQKGRQLLKYDPEVTAKSINGMTGEEKSHFQIGLTRALQDKIADNPQAAIRFFDKGSTEAKMRAGFPSSKAYNSFKRDVLRQATFHRTYTTARTNSPSVRRVLGVADLADEPNGVAAELGAAARDVYTGNKFGLLQRGINATQRYLNRPSSAVAEELAPVLYSNDPAIQARVIARLKARGMMR